MDSTQEKIAYALGLNVVLIIIGSLFYKTIEGWNWIDAIYFSVGTLMTVGFGDLHATHSISRVFATIFMIIGIPVMLYTVTLIGAYSVEKRAYTRALRIFHKTPLEHLKYGKGKAHKLVEDVEKLSEQLTSKMKQLEEEEEKQEKELAKKIKI